ncbi:MAG: single-stranded DNA-binding protein [Ignavibacteria bacterium]|nr:single-stranded DNA-binding protein [Ignavibacteria bacterium]
MSRCFNKVILIGFVASEPEYKKANNGVSILTFRLLTLESYKTADGRIVDRSDWFSIVAWRNLADVSKKILKKGTKVFIEGVLRSRDVQLKNGDKVQKIEIVAENILTLEGKRQTKLKENKDIISIGDDIELPDFLEEIDNP